MSGEQDDHDRMFARYGELSDQRPTTVAVNQIDLVDLIVTATEVVDYIDDKNVDLTTRLREAIARIDLGPDF